ncbi:MAG TPA: hypothetical protein VMB25_12745 [Bryobacteraceae bacterium]|nr:hypothetical protein [Bryobacteraceae bacterium]
MRLRQHLLWALPLLTLAACSEAPKETGKAPVKAPEALTGRQAFQRIYPQARVWATDAQLLQLTSVNLTQVKSENGKAGVWQAILVSPSRAKARTYTYSSVDEEPSLHEGVFPGMEEDYSPHGASTPFAIAALKVDSDQALETASKKSQEYIKKNPAKPVVFLLEQTRKFPDPAWRVIWGESVGTSDYSVFVDASSGAYLQTMH